MPSLSPRMQQLQGGMSPGPDQATELFEQGLSEMAYQLLTQRMPDLVPDVVTFKVIATDVDKGYGVGAFVVSRGNSPIYVPVVMSNNAIKPLEVMYHKALNVFLPLNKGWLDEMDKAQLSTLGMGVKTPETLYTDVDIRNIVVPPITGRFSYAAAPEKHADDVRRSEHFPLDVALSLANLEKTAATHTDSYQAMLLPLLTVATNRMKVAFGKYLERNPRIFKVAAEVYGISGIANALLPRLEKVAAKQLTGGALWIVDKDNTPTDFKRIFGDRAAEAYAGVRKSGFASKDDRLDRNMAVQEQPYETWTEPNQPGIYMLCDTKGTEDGAFVMPNPTDVFDHERTRYGRRPAVPGAHPRQGDTHRDYGYGRPDEGSMATHRGWNSSPYLAVFGNGNFITPTKLVGRQSIADEVQGNLHKRLFVDVSGSPRVGKGFFVRQKGTTFQATVPIEIKSISNDKDNVRHITASPPDSFGGNEIVIATDSKNAFGQIWMPKGSDVVYLPPDFVWIPLKTKLNERAWFQSALDLSACASSMLASVGAKKVAIKDAGARQFSIDGARAMDFVPALRKLAVEHVLSVDDAQKLLEKAASERHIQAWVASPAQLAEAQRRFDKLAGDDDKKKSDSSDKPKKKSPPSGGGGGAPGGPPSPDGMDDPGLGAEAAQAAMGPPPAPPPPSATELAAMEMDQAIQQEMQKLQDQQQMLAALVQRSHEIAGGAPPAASVQTQAMGAPPPSQNLVTGGPPPQQGPAGMMGTPNMPGPGMQPPGGAMGGMPGMDPSMGGMPPSAPGMDPSMGQMDPSTAMSGMDPSMGGMGGPMNAMMPPNGPNTGSLQSEINPQFLDQAAQMNSADTFDAAAVALLAQSPELHAVVGQYLPNLEKSVDNVARVMLTLWMQESDLKERVGEETFDGLEQAITATFKGMGELVLRLARGVQGAKDPEAHAAT